MTKLPKKSKVVFSSIEDAVKDVCQGKMIVIVDDEDRENEGDLCLAAELVTPEAINFMAKYGRGLICLTLTENKIKELQLAIRLDFNFNSIKVLYTLTSCD